MDAQCGVQLSNGPLGSLLSGLTVLNGAGQRAKHRLTCPDISCDITRDTCNCAQTVLTVCSPNPATRNTPRTDDHGNRSRLSEATTTTTPWHPRRVESVGHPDRNAAFEVPALCPRGVEGILAAVSYHPRDTTIGGRCRSTHPGAQPEDYEELVHVLRRDVVTPKFEVMSMTTPLSPTRHG